VDDLLAQLRSRDSEPSRRIAEAISDGAAVAWERSDLISEHLFWISSLRDKLRSAGQEFAVEMNNAEIEALITALGSPIESPIILGSVGDPEALYSVMLNGDGVLLGCLALPVSPPRRC
jgi:hypothetical protein